MSGHSHWATIRRKKGAADAKRGAIFTRLAREIVMAARLGGGNIDGNVRLQIAVEKARAQNMPKDNIERAIRRGTGEDLDGASLEEITFEGYGPHGSALMVECMTDNRNRTVADLRYTFNRNGGNMAEAGSVGWQFERKSYFSFPTKELSYEKAFELAVDVGADEVNEDDGSIEIIGSVEAFKIISDALHKANIHTDEAGLRLIAKQYIELGVDQTLQVLKVIDAIEELDDVQNVYHNLIIPEDVLNSLETE